MHHGPDILNEPKSEVQDLNTPGFPYQARAIIEEVQSSMAALMMSIPVAGTPIKNAAALQKALGLDRKLAWQVFRLATMDDPLAAGLLIPGKPSLTRIVAASSSKGLPESVVTRLRQAMADFQNFVEHSAGGRDSFDSILSGMCSEGSEALDLVHKRAMHRALSHFLGAHAHAMVKTWIFHPNASDPSRVDMVNLGALVSLRRLRLGLPLVLASHRSANDDGSSVQVRREPLDRDAYDRLGIALIEKYSSQPLPRFERKTSHGLVETAIVGDTVGTASASTCFIGEVTRSVTSRYRHSSSPSITLSARVRVPSETLYHDVIIAQGVFGNIAPRIQVYAEQNGSFLPNRAQDRLAVHESTRFVRGGIRGLRMPDVPEYTELLRETLTQLGWQDQTFDAYRCVCEFPLVPSSVSFEFDLNPQP